MIDASGTDEEFALVDLWHWDFASDWNTRFM